jgi:AcrR family transcriptional regulator
MAVVRISGAERRQRILDVATDAFAERGYHATSVGEIAATAGITKPVLYDHFDSKQGLFVELMEKARDELTARGAEAMSREAPVEQRVRSAVDAFFAYVEERPAAARVLLTIPKGEAELVEATRDVQAEATARLAALLAHEPDLLADVPGRERRLELATEFIKQGMHGLAEWWSAHPDMPREVLVDTTMDVAWIGLSGQLDRSPEVGDVASPPRAKRE